MTPDNDGLPDKIITYKQHNQDKLLSPPARIDSKSELKDELIIAQHQLIEFFETKGSFMAEYYSDYRRMANKIQSLKDKL